MGAEYEGLCEILAGSFDDWKDMERGPGPSEPPPAEEREPGDEEPF